MQFQNVDKSKKDHIHVHKQHTRRHNSTKNETVLQLLAHKRTAMS